MTKAARPAKVAAFVEDIDMSDSLHTGVPVRQDLAYDNRRNAPPSRVAVPICTRLTAVWRRPLPSNHNPKWEFRGELATDSGRKLSTPFGAEMLYDYGAMQRYVAEYYGAFVRLTEIALGKTYGEVVAAAIKAALSAEVA